MKSYEVLVKKFISTANIQKLFSYNSFRINGNNSSCAASSIFLAEDVTEQTAWQRAYNSIIRDRICFKKLTITKY